MLRRLSLSFSPTSIGLSDPQATRVVTSIAYPYQQSRTFLSSPTANAKTRFRKTRVTALQTSEVEPAFENDRRKKYFKWLCLGLAQFGVLALGSSMFMSIKRMRMNVEHLESLQEELVDLETKDERSPKDMQKMENLKEELLKPVERMPFFTLITHFSMFDWLFVGVAPLAGLGIFIILRNRIFRMVAKIELLNKTNKVRFWTYDGLMAQNLVAHEVPFSSFPETDIEVPKDNPMFSIDVEGRTKGLHIEQTDAKFYDREKLMSILSGRGSPTGSPKEALNRKFS